MPFKCCIKTLADHNISERNETWHMNQIYKRDFNNRVNVRATQSIFRVAQLVCSSRLVNDK